MNIYKNYKFLLYLVLVSLMILPISYMILDSEALFGYFIYIPVVFSSVQYNRVFFGLFLFYTAILTGHDLIYFNNVMPSTIFDLLCLLVIAVIVNFSTNKLKENRDELKSITEASLDIISRVNKDGIIEFVTPSIINILGYSKEGINGKAFLSLVYDTDKENVSSTLKKIFDNKIISRFECRLVKKDGSPIWVETLVNPVNSHKKLEENVYVFGSRDISERKSIEALLNNYSYTDFLTGLYNRRYLDEKVELLNATLDDKIGLFICDIDSMKMVNDKLGHKKGDELLLEAADVLNRTFVEDCIIARFGGDEFAILVTNATEERLENLHKLLKKNLIDFNKNEGSGYLSISAGYSKRTNETLPLNELFLVADKKMYEEKAVNHKFLLNSLEL